MLLLDTHVLLWLDQGNRKLGDSTRRMIDSAWQQNDLAVCAISFWEIATLCRKGRLEIDSDLIQWRADLIGQGLNEISMTGDIAVVAGEFVDFPADPADRIIAATAQRASAYLCTADEQLLSLVAEEAHIDARH